MPSTSFFEHTCGLCTNQCEDLVTPKSRVQSMFMPDLMSKEAYSLTEAVWRPQSSRLNCVQHPTMSFFDCGRVGDFNPKCMLGVSGLYIFEKTDLFFALETKSVSSV